MPDPTLHAYYYPRPGGHIRVTNAPTPDAATTLLARQLGTDDVYEWAVVDTKPLTHQLASIDWIEESEEAWLAEHGWADLINILTAEEVGFCDPDLTEALTERRGPITAAVLRIAANIMSAELATLKQATDAGIPSAQTTLTQAAADPVDWLHRLAALQEHITTE